MAGYSTYRVSVKEPGRDWKSLGSESATSKAAVKRYFGPFPRGTKWRISKARESMYERVNSGSKRMSKKKKKKKSAPKRISAALTRFLKKQNPAFKRANAVRVKKSKSGAVTFSPVHVLKRGKKARRVKNVERGFYDATGFHPIRSSRDYDPDRAGDEY